MKLNHLLCALACLALINSCSTSKENNLPYFKNLAQSESGAMPVSGDHEIRLVPDDELVITITSSVREATSMYNVPLGNPATRGDVNAQGSVRLLTYIVDKQGNIELPVIGTMHVAGLTTEQVQTRIKEYVSKTVKDPYVRVELLNFTVNVMGEVRSPRQLTVNRKKITVLDALAAAGDLTEYARRDNVLVIRRNESGQSVYHRINLNDTQLFASPVFYLQQDDIVYVEPNEIKSDNSKYNQNNAYKLTVVSTVVSAASVIASMIIALTVK